ncbi:MAG TPA: ATP-dependent DNA helicase RecQ [Micromonosporaceae bacterium]|nr:ATP-dependent DNA helicase RecQ [Micromonosporaceae bacterium]
MKLFPSQRLRQAAKRHFGWRRLRPGQLDAMLPLLRGRDVMVVLPTGAGKSAIYQVPATLLRGPTLVISPLLALQHDQITSVNERGTGDLRAVRVNSSQTPAQRAKALEQVRTGEAKLLFITPEQLASPERLAEVAALKPALVAVDEAHCISAWGYDFRPDYLALGHAIRGVGRPPVVALTATASPPVRDDIAARLGLRSPKLVLGGLDRPNLFLEAVHCPTEEHRWKRLLMLIEQTPGSGIAYVPTRRAAEELAGRLAAAGVPAAHYHGGMAAAARRKRHEDFAADRTPVMVATSAFGMGIDKPNIRWVAHMALPDSPDSYLQEVGRAGRDGRPARAALLWRPEDIALQRYFAGGSPDRNELLYLASGVRAGVHTRTELAKRTGMTARKVASLCGLLEEVGAVAVGANGELRLPPYAPKPPEAAKLAVAEAERHQVLQRSRTEMMRGLAEAAGCRVQALLAYFGEQMPRPCGHCDNCGRGTAGRKAPSRARQAPRTRAASHGTRSAGGADGVPYPLHSTVTHRQWGPGTVLGYDDDRMTVLFDEVGYKTLSVAVVRDNGLLT